MTLSRTKKNTVFLFFLLVEVGFLCGWLPQNPWILAVRIALVVVCFWVIFMSRERGLVFADPAQEQKGVQDSRELAGLYHEIRNCTSTLKGNAVLLKQSLQTEAQRAPVERIERVADSIERIAREVMHLADPDLIEPTQEIRIDALIRECMNDYFPGTPEVFSMDCPGDLPPMEGDPTKLRQAFVNLFKNSLEADASRVQVRISRNSGGLGIVVKDDGLGCQPKDLEKIFLPLHTTKKDRGGMGLGLALVKAIIHSHGGTLWADSLPRSGKVAGSMTVHMTLPLAYGTLGHGSLAKIAGLAAVSG